MFEHVVNMTPHNIVVRDEKGEDHVLPPFGIVLRFDTLEGEPPAANHVATTLGRLCRVQRLGLYHSDNKDNTVTYLCSEVKQRLPEDTQFVVVSALVANHPDAYEMARLLEVDFISPDTRPGKAFRNKDGQIIAVEGFILYV